MAGHGDVRPADPEKPYVPTAEDAQWREVRDPERAGYMWRMRALVLEFQWAPVLTSGHHLNGYRGPWFTIDGYEMIFPATPARKAIWQALLLNPCR